MLSSIECLYILEAVEGDREKAVEYLEFGNLEKLEYNLGIGFSKQCISFFLS